MLSVMRFPGLLPAGLLVVALAASCADEAPAPPPARKAPAPDAQAEAQARAEFERTRREIAIDRRRKEWDEKVTRGADKPVLRESELVPPPPLESQRHAVVQTIDVIRGETRSKAADETAPEPAKPAKLAVRPAPPPAEPPEPTTGAENYQFYGINPFVEVTADAISTFSTDVDTASYTIARRKIREGQLPPRDAVRVEEFVNYFRYDLPEPVDGPFSVTMDAAPSPFTPGHHLLRVGLQARRLDVRERRRANLVFLVDVSGSMQSPDKLPLAQRALRLLVDALRDGDTVSLVTYAGGVREVLPPTGLEQKARIHEAIESLTAGGGTGLASGLELAYRNAAKTLSADSTSRVIVLSDGDANLGPASPDALLKAIAGHVKEGVFLSVVGFGMGNYKDALMEQVADKGNGNYTYVDTISEARRVFRDQLAGTLEVVAKDAKVQVEFDREVVRRYRLVGYENRNVADRDFRNDAVDAGEVGSGQAVTALYELELAPGVTRARLATVRVRAKKALGSAAEEWAFAFDPSKLHASFDAASRDLRFAVAVMGAAEIFRQSPHARDWRLSEVQRIAAGAAAGSPDRREFLELLERASAVFETVAAR